MRDKFVKLTISGLECYVDPFMIVSVKEFEKGGKTVVNTLDGQSIYPDQTVQEVIKLIKIAETLKFSV